MTLFDERTVARDLFQDLFPLCRSLTGAGVRQTLRRLGEIMPLTIQEYPSGTKVYDWTIPPEWTIRDAYVADASGRRLIDFRANNLHLVGYSTPIQAEMGFAELAPHLHTHPDWAEAIPYRTAYYQREWGFCLSQRHRAEFDPSGHYQVVIDADLAPGSLTLADAFLPGEEEGEYLISTYCCHPSLANDNLSGLILVALLYNRLAERPHRRFGYRFVICPETIGAITYLAHHQEAMQRVRGGFVVTCVAGPGPLSVKHSYQGNHELDRATQVWCRDQGLERLDYPFSIHGSDERQYSPPPWRIPMISICKDKYYEYPQYHTSLDNLDFVSVDSLLTTLDAHVGVIDVLERNRFPLGKGACEPCLSAHNIETAPGGTMHPGQIEPHQADVEAWLWTSFYADGQHDLLAIAEQTGLSFAQVAKAATQLRNHQLLDWP